MKSYPRSYPWTSAELVLVPLGFLLHAVVIWLYGPQIQDAVRIWAEGFGWRLPF